MLLAVSCVSRGTDCLYLTLRNRRTVVNLSKSCWYFLAVGTVNTGPRWIYWLVYLKSFRIRLANSVPLTGNKLDGVQFYVLILCAVRNCITFVFFVSRIRRKVYNFYTNCVLYSFVKVCARGTFPEKKNSVHIKNTLGMIRIRDPGINSCHRSAIFVDFSVFRFCFWSSP